MIHLEISQIIGQLISFLIMLWILKKLAWRPLLKILADRKAKIEAEFNEIDKQKKQLADLINNYQERLQAIEASIDLQMKQALLKAEKLAEEIEARAHDEAELLFKKTAHDLSQEIIKAKNQLKNELVTLVFAKLNETLKMELSLTQQKDLILKAFSSLEHS